MPIAEFHVPPHLVLCVGPDGSAHLEIVAGPCGDHAAICQAVYGAGTQVFGCWSPGQLVSLAQFMTGPGVRPRTRDAPTTATLLTQLGIPEETSSDLESEPENDEAEDEDEAEAACAKCGTIHSTSDMAWLDDREEWRCCDCYGLCNRCDEPFDQDDLYWNEVAQESYCQACDELAREDQGECNECGVEAWSDNLCYDEASDQTLCEECYRNLLREREEAEEAEEDSTHDRSEL